MKRIQFNTGRPYQADGQRIVVQVSGAVVQFNDVSRMVCGEVEIPEAHAMTDREIVRRLLVLYDTGRYIGTPYSLSPIWNAGEPIIKL